MGVVLGALLLLWRLTLGASSFDEGHAVALALRLARGDQPLSDEMNIQAFGAVPAVPFTYAWDRMVGTSGIVLASRGFFAVLALGCGLLAYRGLRAKFSGPAAAAGVLTAMFALPYHLPLTSYSSVPVLALVLGSAAAVPVIQERSAVWSAVLGTTAAVGAISSPQLFPAFLLLLVTPLIFARTARATAAAAAGAVVPALTFVLWLLLGPGVQALAATLDFQLAYQQGRGSGVGRLWRAIESYAALVRAFYWPLLIGVALSVAGALRPAWSRLGRAGTAGALAWAGLMPVVAVVTGRELRFGKTTSALLSVIVLVLIIPAAVRWLRSWRRPRRADVGVTVTLLSSGCTASTIVAATTSSGPQYSVHGASLVGLAMLLVASWADASGEHQGVSSSPRSSFWLPALAMATLFVILPFQESSSWSVDTRISSGPWSGLVTTRQGAESLDRLERAVNRAPAGSGVLILGNPGGYLVDRHRMDTNILWIDAVPSANSATLAWMERTGRVPDLVLITSDIEERAGGTERWAATDDLRRWIGERYVVDSVVPGLGTTYRLPKGS